MNISVNDPTLSAEEQLISALILIGDGRQGARTECSFFIQSVDRVREHIMTNQKSGKAVDIKLHDLHDRAGRLYPGVARRMMGQPFAA